MEKKKKKAESKKKTVRFERFEPFAPPHEGTYYQLLVFKKPDLGAYSFTFDAQEPGWRVEAEADDVLGLSGKFNEMRKVYTQVQIRKVTREVVLGGE